MPPNKDVRATPGSDTSTDAAEKRLQLEREIAETGLMAKLQRGSPTRTSGWPVSIAIGFRMRKQQRSQIRSSLLPMNNSRLLAFVKASQKNFGPQNCWNSEGLIW
jgi:hypothetical protein